jgi:hypothetical protein
MVRSAAVCCVALACTSARGGLVYGPDAMDLFEDLYGSLGGAYLSFDDVPAGTNLMPGADPWSVGARFASIIYTNGQPFGPEHVEVSNRHHAIQHGNSLVGSPFPFGSDDARVGYEIRFDETQGRVGMERVWNTFSVTRFYNAAGDLLAEHVNTVSTEFVGWFAEAADGSDRVARVVLDGNLHQNSRQVGHTDDLYFGLEVPAPGSIALIVLGVFAAGGRGRGRAG